MHCFALLEGRARLPHLALLLHRPLFTEPPAFGEFRPRITQHATWGTEAYLFNWIRGHLQPHVNPLDSGHYDSRQYASLFGIPVATLVYDLSTDFEGLAVFKHVAATFLGRAVFVTENITRAQLDEELGKFVGADTKHAVILEVAGKPTQAFSRLIAVADVQYWMDIHLPRASMSGGRPELPGGHSEL